MGAVVNGTGGVTGGADQVIAYHAAKAVVSVVAVALLTMFNVATS